MDGVFLRVILYVNFHVIFDLLSELWYNGIAKRSDLMGSVNLNLQNNYSTTQ